MLIFHIVMLVYQRVYEALLRQTFVAFYLASPARMAPVLYASTRDYLGYGLDMGGKKVLGIRN
jgi:hypothetical protein